MHWLEIRQNPQENKTNRNTEAVIQGQWTDCVLWKTSVDVLGIVMSAANALNMNLITSLVVQDNIT